MMHPVSSHTKTDLLQIPTHGQQRLRAQTITTPLGTPHGEPLVFLSDAQIQDLLESRARNWDRLPTEIKANILCFLSATDKIRCRAVNREFQTILTNGSLWQTLDTSSFYTKVPADQLCKLIEAASPFVQNLNLRGCSQLKSNTNLRLNGLVTASFEGCRFFSSSSLSCLLHRNTRLQQLDVSGLNAVDDHVLVSVADNCHYLDRINVSYCKNISSEGLQKFIETMTDLRDLRVADCRLTSGIMLAINGLRSLDRLSLSGCSSLEDSFIKDLIYGSHHFGLVFPESVVQCPLMHLDISRCPSLTSACLKYMQTTMPRLQKLELAGLTSFTDAALVQTLPGLAELTHLDLEDCNISDWTLATMAMCTNLRHVQLSHCTLITDYGVLALVDRLTLNHLDLDNTKITNQVLSAVAAQPQQIRLSIYDCPHITWTGVLSILTANSANPSGFKRLKTFYGWQRPVDGHTKRIMKNDLVGAREIEREWTAYMMHSSEEIMRTGEGRTRFLDFDDEGVRIIGRERRRPRACLVM